MRNVISQSIASLLTTFTMDCIHNFIKYYTVLPLTVFSNVVVSENAWIFQKRSGKGINSIENLKQIRKCLEEIND